MISVIHLPPEDKIPNASTVLHPLEETKKNPYFEPSINKEVNYLSSNGFSVVQYGTGTISNESEAI